MRLKPDQPRAVVGGVAVVLGLSHVTDIAEYTINVCSLIGTGVAIDYSLFIVSRYREELAAGKDLRDALIRAIATAGRVVAFSGIERFIDTPIKRYSSGCGCAWDLPSRHTSSRMC